MVKPAALKGCGARLEEGESAVSFEISEGRPFYYRSWAAEANGFQKAVWHCGVNCPYRDARPEQERVVYYCRSCQIKAGLIW